MRVWIFHSPQLELLLHKALESFFFHQPHFATILPQPYAKLTTFMHILIAEDDEVLADGLCLSMRQQGYAVDYVSDGLDADMMLRGAQPFDLVVLDLGLPRLDGLSVLRNMRERNRQIPVRKSVV